MRIEAENMTRTFRSGSALVGQHEVHALRGVSLVVEPAESLALIGESGSGKTTFGRILAGLESYDSGRLLFDGVDLSRLSAAQRKVQFRRVQLIPQDPYSALNPSRTIGQALEAPLALRARETGRGAAWVRDQARSLLDLVGLDPESTLPKYPHNLSGGGRQRVVIARAMTVDPEVLVADEAVSMIDVSLRMGILTLLDRLRRERGLSVMFITHDVAAARYVSATGSLAVMYRGEVVESGATDQLIEHPMHPYTQALLSAMPVLYGLEAPGPDRFFVSTDDAEPAPPACLFSPRCPFAQDRCRTEHPTLAVLEDMPGHDVACFYPVARQVTPVELEPEGVVPG